MSSFRHTMQTHLGDVPVDHDWRAGFGTPLRTQLAKFARDTGEVEAMALTYVAYNNIHHDRSVEPYPGIHDALDALRARVPAAPFAIVTSKNRRAMLRGLQVCRLERYFDVCVTVDDVQRFKPHPEPVRTALDQLSVDPTATVFIGDSPHDMAAGRAAGVRTAAALWGPFAKESLAEQAPDFWLPHPRDIEHLGNHP